LDKSDFDSNLASLTSAYTKATKAMETQSLALKRAKQELSNVEKRKNEELRKGTATSTEVNKMFKEELALARQAVKYRTEKVNANKQNIEYIKATITHLKAQTEAERSLANVTTNALADQKRQTIALKDRLGVTSKAEQVARKYADQLGEVNIAEKKGILTAKEATIARTNLDLAKRKELLTQKESVAYRNTAINGLVRHIRKIESLVIAFYGLRQAYEYTFGMGHEFNKMIESEQIGIALSIVQKLEDVDATGKQVTALEKWRYANIQARKEMEEVRKINVFTPHTLAQTVQVYKVISGQVRAVGGDMEDSLRITKQLSILAKAGNVEFSAMLKTIDQLFSGQMKASDMQIALKNIVGLSQEETREAIKQGKVLEYVSDKLKNVEIAAADVAQSWGGVTANFQNAWTDIFATLQQPMFDAFKEELRDATAYLIENKEEIIDGFKTVGKAAGFVVDSLDELIVAYSLYKAVSSYSTFMTAAKEMEIYTGMASRAIIQTKALTLARTTLNAVFSPANLAIAGLVVAYSMWDSAQEKAIENERNLEKAMGRSVDAIKQLSAARLKGARLAVEEGIKETQSQINKLVDEMNGHTVTGILLGRTKADIDKKELIKMEAQLDKLKDQRSEQQKRLSLYNQELSKYDESGQKINFMSNQMGQFTEETYKALQASNNLKDSLTSSVLALNKVITRSAVVYGNMTDGQKLVIDKQAELTEASKKSLRVQKELKQLTDQAKTAEGADKEKVALAIGEKEQELLKAKTAEIKANLDLVEIRNKLNLESLNNQESLLKLSLEEETLNKRMAGDKKADIDGRLKVAKLEYEFAMKRINANKQGLTQDEIKIAKQTALNALKTAEVAHQDAISSLTEKTAKSAGKVNDEYDKLYGRYLEITGRGNELEIFNLNQTIADFKEAGFEGEKLIEIKKALIEKNKEQFDKDFSLDAPTLFDEVFDPYANLIESQKEYIKNIKEAGGVQEKIDKINAKQVDLRLKGYAGMANGMKNMFQEGSKGYRALEASQKVLQAFELAWYIKKQAMLGVQAVLNQASGGDPYSAWGRMAAMASVVAGLGVAIGGIGGGSVSQAEIDAAKGRTEFDDKSLKNLESIFESAQYPMLEVTNKMYKHIRNMDANFYSVARAMGAEASAGGVDLTGVNFVDTYKSGFLGFSSKTVSLIGTGLTFAIQNLGDAMNAAELDVRAYTTTLVQKSSWWGMSNSSKIKESFKDLPASVVNDIADSFASGYEAIMTAGVALGLDGANLTEALQAAELKIGKADLTGLSPQEVSDRLNDVFSTALSGVVTSVDDFSVLVTRYAQNAEYALETLIRIGTEYDQASHMFRLIGRQFADGALFDVTTQVETELTRLVDRAGNAVIEGAHKSLSAARLGIHEETWTEITEVITQQVYTAQLQILDIVESTGGQQAFADAMGAFMENFYTEAEQVEFLTESMSASFATLGLEMPKTNEGFRNLLETLNTGTQEGAYLYGQVLLLADGFANMTRAAEQLNDSAESTADAVRGIADAWLGNLSYLTMKQKAEFASGYLALGLSGVAEIDTVEAAKMAAETALKTSATREEYIPVFNKYIQELEKEAPEATTDDVVARLDELIDRVQELEETTRKVG
jgi:hypothetical protein